MSISVLRQPPDGGYGWVIVFSSALSSCIIVPFSETFGILFKDISAKMELSSTEIALILNLNSAFGMIMGPISGVFLKFYGYRPIALFSSILISSSLILISFTESFSMMIIFYGLITSLGMGMNMSANILALNAFFHKKRSKAIAVAVTIPGLGSILMPQLIKVLQRNYTDQGVVLICAGLSAHLFVSALLLQPVEWHLKGESSELKFDSGNYWMEFFDFSLLKNWVFLNIMFGLALEFFAEINFILLIPFILDDVALDNETIANVLSTMAITDIIFRVLAPYLGNLSGVSARNFYTLNLFVLVLTRFCFIWSSTSNTYILLLSALSLGMVKGIRKVYMGLILPNFVPFEKLSTAVGLVMFIEGLGILIGGTIMGLIKDITGNYTFVIIIINCITVMAASMWGLEFIFFKHFTIDK